ncbi:MAG: hypothetical protein IMF09_12200 [Proteobacteria bacterium]|nr:hypothetical protein [Pseudomonadota bacterium]
MKKLHLILLSSMAVPFLLGASSKQETITSCLDLAPDNEVFEINLHMNVNTTTNPITKSGMLELSNDKQDDITKSEQEAFKPVRECLMKLIG